jgi:signal transduction histidine kinase/DNA-binding response OmpR family regulator/ligand-binding sensor domain-containing protein
MKEFSALLFFIIFFTSSTCLTGQDNDVLQTHSISIPDGLLSPAVSFVLEDSRGIIWIGTDYGLNSYNGISLTAYTSKEYPALGNQIIDLIEDTHGNIWVRSSSQSLGDELISIVKPLSQEVLSVEEYCPMEQAFDFLDINTMRRSYDGTILIVTDNATVCEYDGTAIRLLKAFNIKTLQHGAWQKIPDNTLIFVQNSPNNKKAALNFYDYKKDKKIDEFVIDFHIYKSFIQPHRYMVDSAKKAYWGHYTSKEFLFYAKPQNGPIELLHKEVIDLSSSTLEPTKDYYHLDNGKNIKRYTKEGQFIKTLSNKEKQLLTNPYYLKDKRGGYWRKDSEEEVLRYSRSKTSSFQFYDLSQGNPMKHFRGGRAMTLIEDSLLVMGAVLNFKAQKLSDSLRIQDMALFSVYDTKKGSFYTGTHTCYQYDYKLNQLAKFEHPDNIVIQYIGCFMEDDHGKIWVGTDKGLAHLDQNQKRLVLEQKYNDFDLLKSSIIYHIHEIKNQFYLCSSTGLYIWDKEKGAVAHYLNEEAIIHLHEDKEGILWLASKGSGLIKFDPKTKEHREFTTKNGLSNNIIYAVYEDDYNKLWMSSNWGIISFDKENYSVTNYTKENGIHNNEFNTLSHYKDDKGNLYFGNQKGLVIFHPKDFQQNQIEHFPILITKVNTILRETDEEIPSKNKHQIDLYPSDKGFVLNVALLDYRNPKLHQYAYKIEGLDNKWHYQLGPDITEKNLNYGHYTIRLKVKGVEGVWIDYPKPIQLSVYRPFYLQWWFIALSITLGLSLFVLLIKLRTRQLLIQQKKLEDTVLIRTKKIAQQADDLKKLDRIKSRFFANISHELRTPLTLIIGPITLLLNQLQGERNDTAPIKKSLKGIKKSSESLLELVEEILDLSKMEAQKLELKEEAVHIASFVQDIYQSFSKQADYLNINYTLAFNIEDQLYLLLDSNKVERMLNNLLSNAFKFTGAGKGITFTVDHNEREIKFIVADTGAGIHPSDLPHVFERFYQSKQPNTPTQGGTGIGLALVAEYTQLMLGSVHANSSLGEGSTFSICLPKQVVSLSMQEQQQVLLKHQAAPILEVEEELEIVLNANNKSITILIVEDHPEIRNFIYSILELDYNVLTASNGLEGLAVLQNNPQNIDLIISDVMMPQMDGFEMLETIKSDKNWQHTPMIMLTARASEEDKLHALTIGVHDYLTKPFSIEELKARINNLLHNALDRKTWLKEQEEPLVEENTSDNKPLEVDLEWIKKVEKLLTLHIDNESFTIALLAESMHLSERHLSRKLKQITGLTPAKMFKLVRLNMARSYLEKGTFATVKEVAFAVGFQTTDNFTKSYKKQFGKLPSAY